MWRAHRSVRYSAAKQSLSTSSHLGRDLSFSLWPTGRTREASATPRRSDSRTTSACLVLVFGRPSASSLTRASSRSWNRVVLVDRLDTASRCRHIYGQLCNPYLAAVMGNYCAVTGVIATGNSVATKVVTTLVGRSAGLGVRALARPRLGRAGARLRNSRSSEGKSSWSGGSAARRSPPGGGREGGTSCGRGDPPTSRSSLLTIAPPPGAAGWG